MKQLKILLYAIAGLVLFAAPAFAQLSNTDTTATGDYAGGSGAQVRVQFDATLGNAIQLTLNGYSGTSVGGTGAAGTVNFDTFDTMCNDMPATGQCVRTTTGTAGAHLVAGFTATVSFSGAPSADVGISRQAAYVPAASPLDVPTAYLKYALGVATTWRDPADGASLPDPLAVVGEDNLGPGVASGDSINHQVALFFPDDSTAGAYRTTVRWTATTN